MIEGSPPIADQVIEDFTRLWRLVRSASCPARHTGTGVTAEQFWLLRCLERWCPLSVGALAEALGITPSSATSACKRLEQAGLVTRTRQAADERVVQVELTVQGRAQLMELRQRQRDAVGSLLAVLNPREQATLQQLLDRMLAVGGQQAGGHPCYTAGPGPRHTPAPSRRTRPDISDGR